MDEKLFQVILSLIPVLGAIITYFVVPYLRTKISNEKLIQYEEWASMAVKAAEMLWQESNKGEDKKEFVVKYLNKMFNEKKVVITEEQLNVLIEAAVHEINKDKKKDEENQ